MWSLWCAMWGRNTGRALPATMPRRGFVEQITLRRAIPSRLESLHPGETGPHRRQGGLRNKVHLEPLLAPPPPGPLPELWATAP